MHYLKVPKNNVCTGFQLDVIELKKEGLTKVIKLRQFPKEKSQGKTFPKPKPTKIPVPIPKPLLVPFTFMPSIVVKDRASLPHLGR